MSDPARTKRVSLGIAISHATLEPGQTRQLAEIAAYCECSKEAIHYIEKTAIRKLQKRLAYDRDPLIRELVETLTN